MQAKVTSDRELEPGEMKASASEPQTIAYIADLLHELERLARDKKLIQLAYYLRQARDAAFREQP